MSTVGHQSLSGAGPFKDVSDWIEGYRRSWDDRLDRLGDYLRGLQSKEKRHGRKKD